MKFAQHVKSGLLLALGVFLASSTSQGIGYESTTALIVAVVLLTLCNVFFKPLLMLFSLPFIILTFGIGVWIINALLFMLVGGLVGGFHVASFGSALWGAFVVSVTGVIANLMFGKSRLKVQVGGAGPQSQGGAIPNQHSQQQARRPLKDDEDVIDI